MPQRILGAHPFVGVQLQERVGDRLTLYNVIEPREAVTQLPWTIKTYTETDLN